MEPLLDPLNDRIIRSVPLPPHKPLTLEQIYSKALKFILIDNSTVPDWKLIMTNFNKQGRIAKDAANHIIN